MDKNKIVLNTLVFDGLHNEGLTQPTMLQKVLNFGIKKVEVRREYFNNLTDEVEAVGKFARDNDMTVYYSVPKTIFMDDGALNPELAKYFAEAAKLNVSSLKMNIGHFEKFTGDLKKELAPYSDNQIEFNVENDQTEQNGSLKNILNFLEAAKAVGLDIKFVFDLGNWRFVGEDEQVVATKIKDYVRYIHVKNVVNKDNSFGVVKLDAGIINWNSALDKLPKELNVALEYPATDDEIADGIDLLVKY